MDKFIGRYELIDKIAKVVDAVFDEEEQKELYATRYERYSGYSQLELEALAISLGLDIGGKDK